MERCCVGSTGSMGSPALQRDQTASSSMLMYLLAVVELTLPRQPVVQGFRFLLIRRRFTFKGFSILTIGGHA